MKFLLPIMILLTAMTTQAAVISAAEINSSLTQSVHHSTDRLKAFVAERGPAVGKQVQKVVDAALDQAEKFTDITSAVSSPNPDAHPVNLLCVALGASAGLILGGTGELGICLDLAGGKDIAAHPGKYAYFLHMVGLGKVSGLSMANKLILVSGSINADSTIVGHYEGTAVGAHGILGLGAGAFLKMESVDPRTLNPHADKVLIHDVTLGAGASISLTAEALDIKKM